MGKLKLSVQRKNVRRKKYGVYLGQTLYMHVVVGRILPRLPGGVGKVS